MPLIQLVYRDDLNDERDNALYFISQCTEYIKYKMLSLSKNKQVLNLDLYLNDPEYFTQMKQQQDKGPKKEENVLFGKIQVPAEYLRYEVEKPNTLEEFNKKVFDLIEIAMDEKRLSQMPSNWHAWF